MPRHPRHQTTPLSTHDELRNLRLALSVRMEQVKLRRLEWDTQPIALPHITPMPGDSELQRRKALTRADIPRPSSPAVPPKFEPGMTTDIYKIMMDMYLDTLRIERDRDPYTKLASIRAQEKLDARSEG